MGKAAHTELKFICDKVVNDPEMVSHDITGDGIPETFCNYAVKRICNYLGYDKFGDKDTANDIIKHCCGLSVWRNILPDVAQSKANLGHIVIAGLVDKPHGHVAVVYPGQMVYSGKWLTYVPRVANVGKNTGIIGVNYAFKTPPEFYCLEKSDTR